jgi:hypothetical protein
MNPWSWFQFVLAISYGDKVNSSPLLSGTWGRFQLSIPAMILPAALLVWLGFLLVRRLRDKRRLETAGIIFVALLLNAGLTLLLTSRAFAYEIFWLVPLIPPIVAVTAIFEPELKLTPTSLGCVLSVTLLLTLVVRCGKVGEVFTSWHSRNPKPITDFVCSHVPHQSTVYGPASFYYYAVEQCGSKYLYAHQWIAKGLSSPADRPVYQAGAFLIWPTATPITLDVRIQEIARFGGGEQRSDVKQSATARLLTHFFPFVGGYPDTVLYRIY